MPTPNLLSRLLCSAALCAAVAWRLSAQTPSHIPIAAFKPYFELFDLPHGDNIQCIAQDHTGFVWFASQTGLYRYDGQHVVTYRYDPQDKASIAGDYIEWIFVDKKNTLWLGCPGFGLSAFDPATTRSVHYTHDPDDPQSLSNNNVWMITEDRQGYIWVATDNGVNRLDRRTGKFKRFLHDPDNPKSLSYDIARSVYTDRQGTVWVGCGVAGDVNDPHDILGGLNRYNGDGTFTRFQHNPGDPNSLSDNRVRALFEDSRGNFWVGTAGTGLHLMDRKRGIFTRMVGPVLQKSKSAFPDNYSVSVISEDQNGWLWIGASQGGLNVFDPVTQQMRHFEDEPGMDGSLQTKSVLTFCQTRDGVIWLGSGNDSWTVYRVKPPQNLFSFFDKRQLGRQRIQVNGMAADPTGGFWAQTTGDFNGILHFNTNKTAWSHLSYEPPVTQTKFLDFFELGTDPFGHLWASTEKGLYKMSLGQPNGKLRLDSNVSRSIAFPHPWVPYFDKKGNIWIPSFGGGLYRFDSQWQDLTHFKHNPADPQSLGGDIVESVFEDHQQNIWVLGGGIGVDPAHPLFLDRYEPATGAFIHYLPPGDYGDPMKAVVDRQGNIWFAAFPYGIRKLNPITREYKVFTQAKGALPDNRLTQLIPDKRGNIWLLGSEIILLLNPETERFFTYTERHGVHPLSFEFISGACTTATGEIVFGGVNGFLFFQPEEVYRQAGRIPPVIRLTDFSIKGRTIVPGNDSPLSRAVWESSDIRLSHRQNVFSFHLANFDFNGAGLSLLEYKLENYDHDWRSDLYNGEASYVNVPPGEYILKVRGANSLGAWSGEQVGVRIVILPPWWRTWWAYLLYAMVAFGMVYFFYKIQIKRRLERLETLRLQELDAFKSKLYTNITHEFRTPLTVITGMAEQLKSELRKIPGSSALNFQYPISLIERHSAGLLRLVNQMLDLSKLESGKLDLHYQQGDVVIFLKYLTESLHSLAESKRVKINFQSDFEKFVVDFDVEHLQQIALNLLSNALKFTPEGGEVTVKVGLADDQSSPRFFLSVTDTGIGIAEEHLPHIFDRFYQAPINEGHASGGAGIGLALTKELVKMMWGEISVKSLLGKGTTFTVVLPVSNKAQLWSPDTLIQEILKPNKVESPIAEPLQDPHLQITDTNPLVLLADDHPDVLTYLKSCLAGSYRLITAKDGQSCLDAAFDHIPDLVIADVMMPHKNGYEVCEALKNDERTSHIPVILLTAKADRDSRLAGLARGADVYLAKPFHQKELLVEIKKLLELRQKLQMHYRSVAGLAEGARQRQSAPKADGLEDYFVRKVRKIVESHLDDPGFTVENLSHEVLLSHSQLHRKLLALTGLPASQFIRNIRLYKAKELLQNPLVTITSVALDTGFNDPGYFSKVFRQEFGMTPGQWRKAVNKEIE
ncbi:MAG: response regulator [Saprospiraceae bacterium]|nr:response regulator [Saprospiraceae bacterium]